MVWGGMVWGGQGSTVQYGVGGEYVQTQAGTAVHNASLAGQFPVLPLRCMRLHSGLLALCGLALPQLEGARELWQMGDRRGLAACTHTWST